MDGTDREGGPDGESDEWRFTVSDVGEESAESLEPGSPSLEHVVFFLLGVAFAVGVLASLFV